MVRVWILDYGTSNLSSVVRAFKHVGADVTVVTEDDELDDVGFLVVPGVGAFGACMSAMNAHRFTGKVRNHIRAGRPYLGICVGMQMMFQRSEEFGDHEGLGVIAGVVKAIERTGADGRAQRVPHIGWRALRSADNDLSGTPFASLDPDASFYFVHSFVGMPNDTANVIATTDYNGNTLTAVVRTANAFGCQFHPEKSGEAGLDLLRNFTAFA